MVHTTSSKHRSTWWSRERMKNISRHRRQDSQVFKGLKGDIEMEDHRAHCLQEHARMSFEWRRASHFVSFRCLGCVNIRSHCVMIFVIDVLASGCSLIWSVCFGTTISEVSTHNLGRLWMDCFGWRLVSNRSAVVKVCHTSKGMALPEVSNMRPRLCAIIVFVSDTMFLVSDTHFSVRAAGTLRSGALRKSQNLDAKDRPNPIWCSEGQVVALGCRVWAE